MRQDRYIALRHYKEEKKPSSLSKKRLRLLNEYKILVDESSIISKTDMDGVITYVNDQFCKVSGYSREELIGRPHSIVRHDKFPAANYKKL